MKKRGFTLIELLVVIAIIGLLAAIVLASLSTARSKANDTSVKGMLHNVRNASAEQYYLSNNSSYGSPGTTLGSCAGPTAGSAIWIDTSSNMAALISAISTAVGGATKMDCGVTAGSATVSTAWSVAVQLPSGTYWCVDNQGAARGASSSTSAVYNGLTTGTARAHVTAGATVCN